MTISLSYYEASAHPHAGHPLLRGQLDADVAIVGGGITGLTSALLLARRGYDVVVLEAHALGAGDSGRNGGQVLPGLACEIQKIERLLDAAGACGVGSFDCSGDPHARDDC